MSEEQPYLQFALAPEITLAVAANCSRALFETSPKRIALIPEQPAWVLGLTAWQGRSVWVADLGALLNLTVLPQTETWPLLVVESAGVYGAFAIAGLPQVRYATSPVLTRPATHSQLEALTFGYAPTLGWLLDPARLLSPAYWQVS
jgi:chemotaxis signal transduction protein